MSAIVALFVNLSLGTLICVVFSRRMPHLVPIKQTYDLVHAKRHGQIPVTVGVRDIKQTLLGYITPNQHFWAAASWISLSFVLLACVFKLAGGAWPESLEALKIVAETLVVTAFVLSEFLLGAGLYLYWQQLNKDDEPHLITVGIRTNLIWWPLLIFVITLPGVTNVWSDIHRVEMLVSTALTIALGAIVALGIDNKVPRLVAPSQEELDKRIAVKLAGTFHSISNQGFWAKISWLLYNVLGPFIMFASLHDCYLPGPVLAIKTTAVFLVTIGLVFLLCWWLGWDPITVMASFRCNAFFAFTILNDEHKALLALILAIESPMCTVLSILALDEKPKLWPIIVKLFTNPTLFGVASAIIVNVTGLYKVACLSGFFLFAKIVGKAGLMVGVLSVGAGIYFSFEKAKEIITPRLLLSVVIAAGLKLAFFAISVWGGASILGIDPEMLKVMVMLASTPCSISAYTFIVELRGQKEADTYCLHALFQTPCSLGTMSIVQDLIGL